MARSSNYELYGDISARVMNRALLQQIQLSTFATAHYLRRCEVLQSKLPRNFRGPSRPT